MFDLDLTAFNVPAGNTVLVEVVSETCYGGVRALAIPAAGQINVVQSPVSVSLLTIPIAGQQAGILINASQDATVLDGNNRNANYGFESSLRVRNDPTSASNRSVTLLKFQLPTNDLSTLEMGLLELNAATIAIPTTAQEFYFPEVYGRGSGSLFTVTR